MAIGHISVRVHSRSQGHSAAAALAYRAGLTLKDSRTGETHNYSRRSDRQGIAAAGLTDGPFRTVGELADAIENAEKRKDASILRDVQPAIPAELDEAEGIALVERFAKALGARYHTTTAWAVHRPDRRSDQRNIHGHVLLPTRPIENGQFGPKKIRALDDRRTGPTEIHAIRALWEQCANEALIAADSTALVDTGRTANPVPTLGPERTGVERRAYRKRNDREPAGLSVPELVEDGAVTGAGRRVARHRSRRRRRRLQDGVPGASVPLSVPVPLLSPVEQLAAVNQELAALELERSRLSAGESARAEPEFPAWSLDAHTAHEAPHSPLTDAAPGTAANPPTTASDAPAPALDAKAPEPAFDEIAPWSLDDSPAAPARQATPAEPAPKPNPRRTRGEDWSVRTLAGAAAQQRTASAPAPVETERTEARADLDAFLAQDPPSPPDAHALAPDQHRDREPLTPDTAPAESPRESKETKTMPPDEIAQQRRRAGPAVSGHTANDGRAPTAQETDRAVQFLKGGYGQDGTPRPALGSAIDQVARAVLVGEPLAADPLAEACASTAAAAAARRMTVASVETFKREHPPQRGIISALEEWRRTLRPGVLKQILTVIVPLEVQHNRRHRSDQARRPSGPGPGPDFGI